MQDFEKSLERTGLLDKPKNNGGLKLISIVLLYPKFHPEQKAIAEALRRYGMKPADLPVPSERDVEKAKANTNGKSRSQNDWIFLTSEPEGDKTVQDKTEAQSGTNSQKAT